MKYWLCACYVWRFGILGLWCC